MTDYTLIRARRRTMSLRLDREGNAIVRAPSSVKQDVIDRFVAAHEDWILRAREKQALHRAAHPEPAEEERAALLARAKEYLPVRVAYWSDVMGLTPAGVKITSARTRFGYDVLKVRVYLRIGGKIAVDICARLLYGNTEISGEGEIPYSVNYTEIHRFGALAQLRSDIFR